MAVLKNVRTGATQRDTSVDLKTFISDNYDLSAPAKTSVNFDTKMARLEKENHVIITRMPKASKHELLGGGRRRYTDVKRVQVICTGHSALNNRYLIEQELEDIINANIRGMQTTYGIDEIEITSFTAFNTFTDQQMDNLEAEAKATARSFAEVIMKYDNYVV